jgi:hypothetical protein
VKIAAAIQRRVAALPLLAAALAVALPIVALAAAAATLKVVADILSRQRWHPTKAHLKPLTVLAGVRSGRGQPRRRRLRCLAPHKEWPFLLATTKTTMMIMMMMMMMATVIVITNTTTMVMETRVS